MTERITKLSPEQEAMLPVVRDEWIEIGLCTDTANRPAAEAGVIKAYQAAELTPPTFVIWLDSPLAGVIGQALMRATSEDHLRALVHRVKTGEDNTAIGVDPARRVNKSDTWNKVQRQVEDQIATQLGASAEDRQSVTFQRVWTEITNNAGSYVEGSFGNSIGTYEIAWLALFDAFSRLGIDVSIADGLAEVEKNAGWWWPLDDAVVLTDRPSKIARDKDGRLHCADGPAVAYRDGFSVYSWHGTRVPADMIEDGGWSTERIFAERNAEIRRCAIERMTWDRFITESGMKPASDAVADPGNAPYMIQLFDLPESLSDMYEEPARILLCTNGSPERDGTRHRFGLVVEGHQTDPIAAAASLYDIPVEAYRQLQVRR